MNIYFTIVVVTVLFWIVYVVIMNKESNKDVYQLFLITSYLLMCGLIVARILTNNEKPEYTCYELQTNKSNSYDIVNNFTANQFKDIGDSIIINDNNYLVCLKGNSNESNKE